MLTAVLGSEMPFNFSDLDTLVDMVTEAHQSEMREYKIRQESIASTTKAMLELLRNWTTKSLPTAEKHGAGHLLNEELGTIQRLIERADTFLPAEH